MNKKRLSVVMAGAMLASSVAPVLAAEVQKSEVSANELGLLMDELRTLVEKNVFADETINEGYAGHSVYAIYVNGEIAEGKDGNALDVTSTQADWQKVFNKLDADDKVEVYSKGFIEKDGKNYHFDTTKAVYATYTKDELVSLGLKIGGASGNQWAKYNKLIKADAHFDEVSQKLVINFLANTGLNGGNNNSMTISVGDKKINEDNYINASGKSVAFPAASNGNGQVTPGMFYGFPVADPVSNKEEVKSSLFREIRITPGGYDLTVEELYDGLMLTEKGHDFFTLLKEARAMRGEYVLNGNNVDSKGRITEGNVATEIKMVDGKARFTVTLPKKGKLAKETYTITGLNEANTERLAKWMVKPLARVDILAGSNRYETAAKIAREYAGLTGDVVRDANDEMLNDTNIVLVNGNALVDGLAAAPLASSEYNVVYNNLSTKSTITSAPILLTEADALPKATKAYLKEVLSNVKIGKLGEVTIHLVGGETVLNKSLERELKALGFKVERYGGDNREETSLEVANAIEKIHVANDKEAFLVGANGEADAMSIAAVAAETKTPIIVSKNGGVSEDAIYELRGKEVTVIGGEAVVSKGDYNEVKAEAKAIQRISGSNRQGTNAEIVKKYYKNNFLKAENIIVAKDGKANKTELVDALAAANMASEKNAPIVLATDKLSKDQLNALILNAKNAEALYQVGHGVARDVVKTIATQLGLTNR